MVFRNAVLAFVPRTSSEWTTANPTLENGQLGIESDTNRVKRGDGATTWNSLGYWLLPLSDLYRGLTVSVTGRPKANEILVTVPIVAGVNEFTLLSTGSGFYLAGGTATTANVTYTLKKNGSTVATITCGATETTATGTVSSTVSFEGGDVLTLVAPETPDTTHANFGITIGGPRIL